MRILWVSTNLLHPLDRGGTLRSYHMLRCLKADHEITYVALSHAPGGRESARATEYCHHLVEVPWPGAPTRGSWRFRARAAANLMSSLPLRLALYEAKALDRAVRRLTDDGSFDLVVADFLYSAQAAQGARDVPRILFQHNIETQIMQRMAEHARGALRSYLTAQTARMRRWEGMLAHRFDHVITVSEEDARLTREWFGVHHVSAVATGVDVTFHHPEPEPPNSTDVVFVGSLDWLPNLDAIDWLFDEVWPLIRIRHPAARLHLVGRRPGADLRRRCERETDVCLWGDAPDVRQHVWRAAVVIVPLRIGGGTRLKIPEALACGKAVVSTPVGAEGLAVEDGAHLVLAKSADAFADAVTALLRDPRRRARLGAAGRDLMVRHFSWEGVTREFAATCRMVAARDAAFAATAGVPPT